MDVNDHAGRLNERGVQAFFASRLAPTMECISTVGASPLAIDVNDYAGRLNERGVQAFFASRLAPTGPAWSITR